MKEDKVCWEFLHEIFKRNFKSPRFHLLLPKVLGRIVLTFDLKFHPCCTRIELNWRLNLLVISQANNKVAFWFYI